MANRVFKFARSKRRKVAIQPIRGQPSACSFCFADLSKSALNAASKADNPEGTGPLAVICSDCIRKLEPLCRLMDWYQCFFRQEDGLWPSLCGVIRRRFDPEIASPATKQIVADLLLRLLKRAFAVVAGYRVNGFFECPRTGVSLAPPRIALVCANPDACLRLVVAGANAVGLPAHTQMGFDALLDDPMRELRNRCNGDPVLLAAVGLLILDYFAPIPGADVGVIYVLETPIGLPGDLEIIPVPD